MDNLILTLKVLAKMAFIWGTCGIVLFLILATITAITGSKTWLRSLLFGRPIHKKKKKRLGMINIELDEVA